MSKRMSEQFLLDCIVAIVKIEDTKQRFSTAQDLLHDYHCWDSVIREFEIVGEAVNTLIKNELLPHENRVAVDFRNLLIHHYFGIDPEEVWNIIEDDLPTLKQTIVETFGKLSSDLKRKLVESELPSVEFIPCVTSALNELLK